MEKQPQDYQIDELDKQILSMLINDATLPYTDIAKKLIISPGTVHVRMKKLKEMGIVTGSTLTVNAVKLGYDITGFVGLFLDKGTNYRDAVKKMKEIPEIIEVYYTTGIYSMFAKIVCRDTQNLREVLNEKIQTIPGVQRTETFISLEEPVRKTIKIL
jgi:Lrp/AsnC family transcriptional regulator for asnA, asnC and gidA